MGSRLRKALRFWLTSYLMVFDSILLKLAATSALFALFSRYLAAVRLEWKEIWFGALVTTGLFAAGKYLIGFLIGNSSAADLYEAAGSLLVLMLWVYYGSAIFLFGASFTFTRAKLLREGDALLGGARLECCSRPAPACR